MALIRSQVKEWLSEAGIAEDKQSSVIDRIFAGHTSTVDALKEERDKYKADADKLPDMQKQLNDAQLSIKDGEGWKDKYDGLLKQHTNANKRKALESALRAAHANESVIGLMLDAASLDGIEIGDDGNLKDAEAAIKPFRDKYAGVFGKEKTEPTPQNNPPLGGTDGDLDALDDAAYYAAVMKKG